jgi:YesN/AraC family two-component response regulator
MPITAIIIDDERLARNELKKLLEQESQGYGDGEI